MCETNDPFAGLEDESFWNGDTTAPAAEQVTLFIEDCPKCRGTGSWRSGYRCFKCKGTGKLEFKTSAKQRRSGRKSAAKSKANKAEATAAAFDQWIIDECPDVGEWIRSHPGDSFAQSMVTSGQKYGSITENMVAAVRKNIARDIDGAEGFSKWCESHDGVLQWLESETKAGNEFAGSLLSQGKRTGSLSGGQLACVERSLKEQKTTSLDESELDLSDLVKGYYAVPDGDTRLKLCVRRPGKNSRWNGWTFVDDGAGYGRRKTYGKQAPDGMYMGSIQAELRAVLADPLAAMVAYGKLTGTCGKCGRLLEDEQSVAAGIGPVCASKM